MKITIRKLKSLNACSESIGEYQKIGKELDHKEVFKLLIKKSELSWANWLITRMLDKNNCVKYAMYAVRAAKIAVARTADAIDCDAVVTLAAARASAATAATAAVIAARNDNVVATYACFAAAFAGDAAARARSALVAAMSVVPPTADEDAATRADAEAAMRIKIIKYGLRLFNKQENKL